MKFRVRRGGDLEELGVWGEGNLGGDSGCGRGYGGIWGAGRRNTGGAVELWGMERGLGGVGGIWGMGRMTSFAPPAPPALPPPAPASPHPQSRPEQFPDNLETPEGEWGGVAMNETRGGRGLPAVGVACWVGVCLQSLRGVAWFGGAWPMFW